MRIFRDKTILELTDLLENIEKYIALHEIMTKECKHKQQDDLLKKINTFIREHLE